MKSFYIALFCGILAQSVISQNNQPVIGILSEPSAYGQYGFPASEYSYIAGSYVNFLESAGARVVPIQWDMPFDLLDELLDQLNGVIFPGGGAALSNSSNPSQPSIYSETAIHILSKSMEYYENGDYFPLWGTCLGFELLTSSIANNFSILIHVYDSDNVARNVELTSYGLKSRMMSAFPSELLYNIEHQNLTFFHHQYTPDPHLFTQNPLLANNISAVSMTKDPQYGWYVASFEGINYPWYGSQFHPEKNTFEWWSQENIPHSLSAVSMEQLYAYFFVNETRKSSHQFQNEETFLNFSIYSYNPYHFYVDPEFEQIYIIPNYGTINPSAAGMFPYDEFTTTDPINETLLNHNTESTISIQTATKHSPLSTRSSKTKIEKSSMNQEGATNPKTTTIPTYKTPGSIQESTTNLPTTTITTNYAHANEVSSRTAFQYSTTIVNSNDSSESTINSNKETTSAAQIWSTNYTESKIISTLNITLTNTEAKMQIIYSTNYDSESISNITLTEMLTPSGFTFIGSASEEEEIVESFSQSSVASQISIQLF